MQRGCQGSWKEREGGLKQPQRGMGAPRIVRMVPEAALSSLSFASRSPYLYIKPLLLKITL